METKLACESEEQVAVGLHSRGKVSRPFKALVLQFFLKIHYLHLMSRINRFTVRVLSFCVALRGIAKRQDGNLPHRRVFYPTVKSTNLGGITAAAPQTAINPH